MNILSTLRKLQPELNHIYTTPPFQGAGYFDCGWFCREHAFHVYVICSFLRISCKIVRGQFLVKVPGLPALCSWKSGADHDWCRVKDHTPVDLSMTFKLFGGGPQLPGPITKPGRIGPYEVFLDTDESVFEQRIDAPVPGPTIC
jgi:hypothetical protein